MKVYKYCICAIYLMHRNLAEAILIFARLVFKRDIAVFNVSVRQSANLGVRNMYRFNQIWVVTSVEFAFFCAYNACKDVEVPLGNLKRYSRTFISHNLKYRCPKRIFFTDSSSVLCDFKLAYITTLPDCFVATVKSPYRHDLP